MRRGVAAIAAVVGWTALVLQYALITQNIGVGLGTWRFFGFFTILSNIGVAIIATGIALGRDNGLTGARARLMGLSAILLVGLTYSLLLRHTWQPQGLQKLADTMLHDVTPILFLILWALMPHGELRWTDLKWTLTPPAVYLTYAMGRGTIDDWYPYYFLNPQLQTGAELGVSIFGTLGVFAIIAGSAIAVDLRLGSESGRPCNDPA
jgi:hypothetical protein